MLFGQLATKLDEKCTAKVLTILFARKKRSLFDLDTTKLNVVERKARRIPKKSVGNTFFLAINAKLDFIYLSQNHWNRLEFL
jgi:hypothetical protein